MVAPVGRAAVLACLCADPDGPEAGARAGVCPAHGFETHGAGVRAGSGRTTIWRPTPLQVTSQSLLVGRTDRTAVQLFRYTLVGGLAFVVDFLTLFLLTRFLGIHYLISAALGFALGLATNYAISVIWVFDRRVVQNRLVEFAVFAVLGILGLGINELSMYVLTDWFGRHYLVSKVGSTGLTYAWNFASRKVLLFSSPGPEQASRPAAPVPVPAGAGPRG